MSNQDHPADVIWVTGPRPLDVDGDDDGGGLIYPTIARRLASRLEVELPDEVLEHLRAGGGMLHIRVHPPK